MREYEPKLLVPNIDDHTFTNDEGIDEDGNDDEEQELAVNVSDEMLGPCLTFGKGWKGKTERNACEEN